MHQFHPENLRGPQHFSAVCRTLLYCMIAAWFPYVHSHRYPKPSVSGGYVAPLIAMRSDHMPAGQRMYVYEEQ